MPRMNLYDGTSIHAAAEALGERQGRSRVNINHETLKERIGQLRSKAGWEPADVDHIMLSVDKQSDAQTRFIDALKRMRFVVDEVRYQDTFVSAPPGRTPGEGGVAGLASLASRATYLAGLLARDPEADLVVVSHAFELYRPLADLAGRLRRGRVAIAYFQSLIDFRFKFTGMLDGTSKAKVKFFDLDLHLLELTGRSWSTDGYDRASGDALSRY